MLWRWDSFLAIIVCPEAIPPPGTPLDEARTPPPPPATAPAVPEALTLSRAALSAVRSIPPRSSPAEPPPRSRLARRSPDAIFPFSSSFPLAPPVALPPPGASLSSCGGKPLYWTPARLIPSTGSRARCSRMRMSSSHTSPAAPTGGDSSPLSRTAPSFTPRAFDTPLTARKDGGPGCGCADTPRRGPLTPGWGRWLRCAPAVRGRFRASPCMPLTSKPFERRALTPRAPTRACCFDAPPFWRSERGVRAVPGGNGPSIWTGSGRRLSPPCESGEGRVRQYRRCHRCTVTQRVWREVPEVQVLALRKRVESGMLDRKDGAMNRDKGGVASMAGGTCCGQDGGGGGGAEASDKQETHSELTTKDIPDPGREHQAWQRARPTATRGTDSASAPAPRFAFKVHQLPISVNLPHL
ncbi:hypothetical protein T484DRAFT_1960385 [Baffinella frigidus]|nr:hypothetical protein T484DRAFT_1960385 [Cryptophyta sp. CCMP2293]